jgi:antimicrobial peptide system SdpB family protein
VGTAVCGGHHAFASGTSEDHVLALIGGAVRRRLPSDPPWGRTYALARTLLAVASVLTLAFNSPDMLFVPRPVEGVASGVQCELGLAWMGLYCLAGPEHLQLARWAAVAVLLLIATGYRPRLLGIPHWWLTFSFQASAGVVDGGDQLAAILTLLLVPVTLLDGRRSHWLPPQPAARSPLRSFVSWWCYGLVRVQVAVVYFHAAVGKTQVQEWVDGTALYYWMLHPDFGAPGWLRPMVRAVVLSPVVAPLAWGVIILEFMLAAALMAKDRYRPWLLAAGLLLHLGIMLVHGLVTFSLVMFAALLLYLPPRPARQIEPLSQPVQSRRRLRIRVANAATA